MPCINADGTISRSAELILLTCRTAASCEDMAREVKAAAVSHPQRHPGTRGRGPSGAGRRQLSHHRQGQQGPGRIGKSLIMAKHLVLVGGGHAHLTCLKNLQEFIDRGHEVTVIGPAAHHYYSGMGPGMLAGTYRPQEIRFNIQKMVQSGGGRFQKGVVATIQPVEKRLVLTSGEEIPYDVVSFNTGSGIPTANLPIAADARVFTVKPIEQLLQAQQHIKDRLKKKTHHIVIAGGGPAGLEITANLWRLAANLGGEARFTLVAGRRLMGDFPEKVRTLALKSLTGRGVEVIEGTHLKEVQTNRGPAQGWADAAF